MSRFSPLSSWSRRLLRSLRPAVMAAPLFAPDGCDCTPSGTTPPPVPTATWVQPGDETHSLLDDSWSFEVRTTACDAPRLTLTVTGTANTTLTLQGTRSGDIATFAEGHSMLGASDFCVLSGTFAVTASVRCADNTVRAIATPKTITLQANARTLPVANETVYFTRVQSKNTTDQLIFSDGVRVHAIATSDGHDVWSTPLPSTFAVWPHMHQSGTHHKFVTTSPSTVHAEPISAEGLAAEVNGATLHVPGTIVDTAEVDGALLVLSHDGDAARLSRFVDTPALQGVAPTALVLPAGEPVQLARGVDGRSVIVALRTGADGAVHFFGGSLTDGGPLNTEIPVPTPNGPCTGSGGTSGTVGGTSTIPMSNGNEPGTAVGNPSHCLIKISTLPSPLRSSVPQLALNDTPLTVTWPSEWTTFDIIDALSLDRGVLLVAHVNETQLGVVVVDAATRTAQVVATGAATRYDGGASSPNAKHAVLSLDTVLFVVDRAGAVKAKVGRIPDACRGYSPVPAVFANDQTLLLRTAGAAFLLGL